MMENKKEHIEILHQRLLVASREQKPDNISNFRRLQPMIILGIDNPLDVERWLVDRQIF